MKQKAVRSHKTEMKTMLSFWADEKQYGQLENIARNLRKLDVDYMSRTELLLLAMNYADIYIQMLVEELADSRMKAKTHDGTALSRM